MKLKIGFFGSALLGLTNGCGFLPNEVESSSPIGYSARWLTERKCDLNGRTCHWEIEQVPQYGNAFKNNGGQIVIDTPGYYRINVALFKEVHDHWIAAQLMKNGRHLAIG